MNDITGGDKKLGRREGWRIYREIIDWQVNPKNNNGMFLFNAGIKWIEKVSPSNKVLNRKNVLRRLMKCCDSGIIAIEEVRVAIHALIDPNRGSFKNDKVLLVSPSIAGNIIVRYKEEDLNVAE